MIYDLYLKHMNFHEICLIWFQAEKKKDTELLASPSKKVKQDKSSNKEYHKEPHVDKQTESDFSKQTRKRRSPRFDNQDTKMLKDMDKSIPKGR